jgi:hypothetical protein
MFYSAVITFGASAIAVNDPSAGITTLPAGSLGWRVLIEPLRGKGAAAYVGGSDVTNTGTGPAIQELSAPAAGVPLDRFDLQTQTDRGVDPSAIFVHGTSGQKCKATMWNV